MSRKRHRVSRVRRHTLSSTNRSGVTRHLKHRRNLHINRVAEHRKRSTRRHRDARVRFNIKRASRYRHSFATEHIKHVRRQRNTRRRRLKQRRRLHAHSLALNRQCLPALHVNTTQRRQLQSVRAHSNTLARYSFHHTRRRHAHRPRVNNPTEMKHALAPSLKAGVAGRP